MKIIVPNSAFLGNIDTFLKSMDTTQEDFLEVVFNEHWNSLHPVVLTMLASIGAYMQLNNYEIKINENLRLCI